jgi:excisionase family DNA binding protein
MEPLLNKNYIVIKEASRHSGYSVDYLMRLCRAGRIQGTQVGRTWLVRRSSLEQFVRAQEEKKREMGRELSKVREQEYKQTQAPKSATFIPLVKATIEKKVNESPRLAEIHPILRPAFALAVTVLVLTASVWAADSGFITRLGGGVIASALRSQDAGPVIPEKTAYALVTVGEYAERGLTALVTGTASCERSAEAMTPPPRRVMNPLSAAQTLAVSTRTVTASAKAGRRIG